MSIANTTTGALGLLATFALASCAGTWEEAFDGSGSAERLLERSIAFHDPAQGWDRRSLPVTWTTLRPNGEVGFEFELVLSPTNAFSMRGQYAGMELDYRVEGESWSATVDGSPELTDAVRERVGLVREDGFFWRNYFGFLGGLPMCLRDGNVELEPEAFEVPFEGRVVQAVRASFPEEEGGAGTDTWTFYFEPETAELVGCRFDRADPERDGETLVFAELVSVRGVRLPARRKWFMNADREYLGEDVLSYQPH